MNGKKITRFIGDALIILSLIGFIYVFYPIVAIYLLTPKIQTNIPNTGTYITIPKISAQAPVKENVDPFNQEEYSKVLKSYVAHAKGTSLPGENGTVFLFAHSSGPPWEQTRFNTIFIRLAELQNGDTIEIKRNGKNFGYIVDNKKEVSPSEVNYLLNTKKTQLILQTCTPIGTDWKRLLVFAHPTK